MKTIRFVPRLKCLLAVSFLMMSCGKKAQNPKESESQHQRRTEPVVTDVEEYLGKQEILCEQGEVCPNYIAKIVVFDKKVPSTCTGFLVDAETVATSTSCLPQLLRLKGQDCSEDVTFFFPATNQKPFERIKCSKVLQVSDLGGKDPVLWRDDVAFLLLERKVSSRRFLAFNRDGIENQAEYTFWGVEQQVDDKTAFIRRQHCQAIHDSYVNPLAVKKTSPNMLFSGCALKKGSTGAPILDLRGRVRAMVSQPMDPGVRAYLQSTGLLTEPLREMFHASNFSCAPTIFDTRVEDERECTKVFDNGVLVSLRKAMLGRDDFYEEKRRQLEEKLSQASEFFNFSVKLVDQGDFKRAEIAPKCFKNVSKWVHTLDTSRGNYTYQSSLPQLGFKRTIGPNGRIGSSEVDNGNLELSIQFSAKLLKRHRRSDVHFWHAEEHSVFRGLTENCR